MPMVTGVGKRFTAGTVGRNGISIVQQPTFYCVQNGLNILYSYFNYFIISKLLMLAISFNVINDAGFI